MTRNLDYRVEVICPVFDEDAQKVIQDILDQQWHDNVRARVLDPDQSNTYVRAKKNAAKIRSQESIHRYLATGKLPRYPKSEMRKAGSAATQEVEGLQLALTSTCHRLHWRIKMIAYTTIGVSDMEKAKAFYLSMLEDIGVTVMMDLGRLAALGTPDGGAMLAICTPYNEEAPDPGNGNMVAIPPGSKEKVDELHAKALSLGASDEGQPGQRMDGFYGGYVRGPRRQ